MKKKDVQLICKVALVFSLSWLIVGIASAGQYKTIASGNWNDFSIWDCSCVPGSSDTLTISSSDTVTLQQSQTVTRLLVVQGVVNLNSYDLYLEQGNALLGGIGKVEGAGNLVFRLGNAEIVQETALTLACNVEIDGALQVLNRGVVDLSDTLDANNSNASWVNSSAGQLELSGAGAMFVTSGYCDSQAQGSKVTFSGSSAQTLCGANLFYHLEINNASGVTVQADTQQITGVLDIASGQLSTNNRVVLVSTDSLTANLASLGGTLSGSVIVERYIDGPSGFYSVGSAVVNSRISDWADDVLITGVSGGDYPAFWQSIYHYVETMSDHDVSFSAPSSITDYHGQKGYLLYLDSAAMPATLRLVGTPGSGTKNIPVSYTNTGQPTEDGWNLVSNPYTCTLDWDAGTAGWTRTNIDDAVYVYDNATGQYASYVSGVGTNGGSQYIASGQAFWVKANASSPALSVKEGSRALNPQTSFRSADLPNGVRLSLAGPAGSDEVVLRFDEGATAGFDHGLEALKLFSDSANTAAMYINTEDFDYSIQALAPTDSINASAVSFYAPQAGLYTFNASMFGAPLAGGCIVLDDPGTGNYINLFQDSVLSVYVEEVGWHHNRLRLQFATALQSVVRHPDCAGATGQIAILATGDNLEFTWSPLPTNQAVQQFLTAGEYSVTVAGANGCARTSTFQLVEPEPLSVAVQIFDAAPDACTGQLEFQIAGGTYPYSIIVEDSSSMTVPQLGLCGGNYSVTVEDENGCDTTFVATVGAATQTALQEPHAATSKSIKTFPNPTTGNITIEFGTNAQGNVLVQLFDLSGRLVWNQNVAATAGLNQLNLNLSVPVGVYELRLNQTNSVQQSQRIAVQ